MLALSIAAACPRHLMQEACRVGERIPASARVGQRAFIMIGLQFLFRKEEDP